ncbi:MAG: alpha/beta fold hydrolase, partial [Alcanivorax sp.]|nr:alpha/beta fold hydrolase [Alcanivorax sp.]
MKQVELVNGDLRFPALMAGSGEPVILLHGFPDTYENWAVQINALAAAGYTAIAPALRGYAPGCQSGNDDYSLYSAVDDLMVFAAQLGGRVHLIGHDWGAAVGYMACAQAPDTFCSFSALAIPPLRRIPQALLKVPEQVLLSGYMQFFQLP